jgi:hypothetical protein
VTFVASEPDCAIHFSLTKSTKKTFLCAFPTFVSFVSFVDSEYVTGARVCAAAPQIAGASAQSWWYNVRITFRVA